ncbi:MAG: hypothetical protein PHS68_06870 [Candidatus Izemoplasmatales bacterium]|nr:hypothetical protein [Candidatus Izemoplasmatales bacterium]
MDKNNKEIDKQNAMMVINDNEVIYESRVYNIDNHINIKFISKQNTITGEIELMIIKETPDGEKLAYSKNTAKIKDENEYIKKIREFEKLAQFIEVQVTTKAEFEKAFKDANE